ncbi:MAG: PadR family transcriptional regulator [Bacilli bacterium]
MIETDNIRGYNDLILLSLLLDDDSYGYSISKQIKELTYGMYIIKETTLYSAFNRLKKLGYIESYNGSETRGRARTYYKITEKGKEFYYKCCREWKDTKKVVNKFIREENND